jgi:hypothetical protein
MYDNHSGKIVDSESIFCRLATQELLRQIILHVYDLTAGQLLLVKMFIINNFSNQVLQDKSFQQLCALAGVYLMSENFFLQRILPNAVARVESLIQTQLQKTLCITLIPDMWDTSQMSDFMGLCANTTDHFTHKTTSLVNFY